MRRPPGRHRWSPPVGGTDDGEPRRRLPLTPRRKAALIVGAALAVSAGLGAAASVGSGDPPAARAIVDPTADGQASPETTATPSGTPVTPTTSRTPTTGRTDGEPGTDRRYANCAQVVAAGLGPYKRDRDPEYRWYVDDDKDGWTCERSDRGPARYRTCAEARAAGVAPLHRGEPGYSRQLDRDGDGVACD